MDNQNKRTEERIKHQLGAKYSNPYFYNETDDAGNVLVHTQPQNSKKDHTCEVVSCRNKSFKQCGKKAICGRYLCKNHFTKGGHQSHAHLQFKPKKPNQTPIVSESMITEAETSNNSSSSSINIMVVSESMVTEAEADTSSNSIRSSMHATLCQVIECNEEAKHRCSTLNCRFTAVCSLHYKYQHRGHAEQTHVDDHKRNKRLKT